MKNIIIPSLFLFSSLCLADYIGIDCAKNLPKDMEKYDTNKSQVSFTAECMVPDAPDEEGCAWNLFRKLEKSEQAFSVKTLTEGQEIIGYEIKEQTRKYGTLTFRFEGITSCDGDDYRSIKLTRTTEKGAIIGNILECACYTF